MENHKKYLLKFYIFVLMYIVMAVFILFLTYKADLKSLRVNIFFSEVNNMTEVKSNKSVIIIDAGHGGLDGGAVGVDGIVEKDINLAISLKLKRLFKISGCEVILTRETDEMLSGDGVKKKKASDLSNRVKIADKYPEAIFISIHMNKFPLENIKGMQIFFALNNINSANLAELLKKNNKSYLQPYNNREIKRGKDIYVLETIKNIGILIECGFLSNNEEARLLIQDDYQNKLAKIIFATVVEFKKD